VLESVSKPKGARGCLELRMILPRAIQSLRRINVGTFTDLRRGSTHATCSGVGIKVGTFIDLRRVSTHATCSGVGIKVRTLTKKKSGEDTFKNGLGKVILRKERMIMKRTTHNQVRAQSQRGVQVVSEWMICCLTSLIQ